MTEDRKQKTCKKHFLSTGYPSARLHSLRTPFGRLLLATLILIWFVLPQTAALAATIYVDNQIPNDCKGTYSIANRDCSGSDGDAYKRPQDAADVVNPGDIVYFREGTYDRLEDLSDEADVMKILRSGTPDKPITFKNYDNEEVIFSGIRQPGDYGHRWTITLGIQPSDQADISGQGVQNIIIDGLIVEEASRCGLMIFGPANRYGLEENPTENVIIRNIIARNNGAGIGTQGKLVNVLIENCEAYNNNGSGITFGRLSKIWHEPEPEDDMSAAQHSVIRNCLSYNNINAPSPGGADGVVGSHMYNCTFEDNVCFGNDDDGIDLYASIESTAKNNIIFNHNYPGGNGAGVKFSSGGGGRHTIAGNIVFNNQGPSFECSEPKAWYRIYYPSRIYSNLAYNGHYGFSLGDSYNLTYPGFEKVYLRDNLALDNIWLDFHHVSAAYTDSDYNFISKSDDLTTLQNKGIDLHSLTGDPGIVNKNVVIDTNFGADWTIEQKLEHIRSQVRAAYSLTSQSQLIDAGIIVDGYHNPNPGDNAGNGKAWYGMAPDIGAYEYALLPVAVIQNEPKQGYAPLTVSFDGSQSESPHGDIVGYEWDFGDGATSQEKETSHTYTSPGEYTVTLKVTDIKGYQGQAQTHIVVFKKEKEFGELPTGCYNNVFNPTKGEKALIVVELQKQDRVRLNLYNTRGDKIRELADEEKEAGTHKYYWDGKDNSGNMVGSGLYFVHIQVGDYKKTKKIVVVK